MKRQVKVDDRMQRGYVYTLTEPSGRNFHPDFQPQLTPRQMLELGVFGGKYMTTARQSSPQIGSRRRGSLPSVETPR